MQTIEYGAREKREAYDHLNHTARDTDVDLVMIGCPHATLSQIRDVCRLLEGRKVHPDSALWVFTPRAIRQVAEQNGYARILEEAGAMLMSDTCPAIGQFLPKGHPGHRHRLGQAGALPTGDHERAGLVRHARELCRCGRHPHVAR